MILRDEELIVLKKIYSREFIEGFYKFVNQSIGNLPVQDRVNMIRTKGDEEYLEDNCFGRFNRFRSSFYDYLLTIQKPLSNSNIYTPEFQRVLNERNWSGFSDRAKGMQAFDILNDLIYKHGVCLDLEKCEFWIEHTNE